MSVYTFQRLIGGGVAVASGNAVPATHVKRAFENTMSLVQGDQALDQLALSMSTPSLSGTQNDFALDTACTLLQPVLSGNTTFTGFAVSSRTQRSFIIRNTYSGFYIFLANANVGSAAGNRIATDSSIGQYLGKGGSAFVYYDPTPAAWRVFVISPGAPITPTFNAGDWTATSGTWTVGAGNVTTDAIVQRGSVLRYSIFVTGTTASALTALLKRAIPFGFTAAKSERSIDESVNAGTNGPGLIDVSGGTVINFFRDPSGTSWTAASGHGILGMFEFEVN